MDVNFGNILVTISTNSFNFDAVEDWSTDNRSTVPQFHTTPEFNLYTDDATPVLQVIPT